ncbi:signal peptidase I [Chloroflexota bacterium]
MKRTVEYIGLTLAIVVMVAAMLTYLAPHFGWRVDLVCSGSMEPELKVGSLVITHPVEPQEIVVGDIITFNPKGVTMGETPVSHRVIGIEEASPLYFKTKGDANDSPDPFMVPARNLMGRIFFKAHYVGYVTGFLQTTWGFLFGLVIPGLTIITMYIISIQRMLRKNREEKLVRVGRG